MRNIMHSNLNSSESGMVSILVTLVMMIVISIVVIGFSQLSRNELTQSLNRQLSAEAFYAANSAINSAAAVIEANPSAALDETNSCTKTNIGTSVYNGTANSTLSAADNVTYACVTVNLNPPDANDPISPGDSHVFSMTPTGGQSVSQLNLSWVNSSGSGGTVVSGSGCPSSAGALPPASSWSRAGSTCGPAVLQVDLISATNAGSLATAKTEAFSFFLYPLSSGGGTIFTMTAPSSSSAVYGVTCGTGTCKATLNVPSAAGGYYVRVMPVYEPADVTISIPGQQLEGSVVEVDATGKAQNVLQRLDAQIPLTGGGEPEFAIQSGGDICKLIEGYAGEAGDATEGSETVNGTPHTCTY